MADKAPNSRRNLDVAIRRIFSQNRMIQVRTIMANTIIGQLLPEGVVKGGSSLKLRYGDKATRFTTDLDAARVEELGVFIDKLESSLEQGWNGFTGRVVPREPAKPRNVPGEYIMQPFDIKLSYLNASWLTVKLELGHDEIDDTDRPDFAISEEIIEIFSELGFPAPKPIACIPIHHQIAQKLHALSSPDSERAHDLIDLQIIINNEKVDCQKTKKACQRLFKSRKQQEWPSVIIRGEGWEKLYLEQRRDLSVLESVDDAILWANEYIQFVDS